MPRLDDLQARIGRAILTGNMGPAVADIVADDLAPAARLQVYRNHYQITLTEALMATFPVVTRLVGERCFSGLAREFAMLSPPKSPCLFEYGAGFPLYLAAVPTLHALPYLADVARLEWAINDARHAADVPVLTAGALTRLPPASLTNLVLTLHPSSRVLASRYPIDRIWRTNQLGSDPFESVSLAQGGVRMLIHRDTDGDAVWRALSLAEFQFLRALRAARTLGEAWDRASAADPAFNGGHMLAGLVSAGVLIDLDFNPTQPKP